MGLRGPQPKPTALRELEGNPGGVPINKREPKPPRVLTVDPPHWLADQGRVYWYRLVPVLSRMGVLTEADLPLLERYCDFLADWRACRDFLADRKSICYPIYDGNKIDRDTGKRVVKFLQEYPHMSKKLRISEHLLKIEMHFGMTPAARTRIISDELYDGPYGTEPINADPFDPANTDIQQDEMSPALSPVSPTENAADVLPRRALGWRKDYFFDRSEAARIVVFFEREIRHMEGEFEGQLVHLERWQRRMLRRLFGWKRRSDGTRKFRKVFLFVPTGNGKSFIVAGIGVYLFAADREAGAQVVAAAADTDQAGIIYNYAKYQAVKNPKLRSLVGKPFHRSMAIRATGSNFRVLSSAANTKHGFNLHGCLIDEVHAHRHRELIDVLITRTRTRRQPLTVYATTAGFDKETICGELYDYAVKVRDGLIDDPEFYPVIFEAGPEDDWRLPETWRKANPNFGVTVKENFLAAECKMAQELPRNESRFKRMHLNMWTEAESPFLPMDKWRACGRSFPTLKLGKPEGTMFTEAELEGMSCYGGLDLASRLDVAALALIWEFSPTLSYVKSWFWVPMDTALDRQRKGQAPYHEWIRQDT